MQTQNERWIESVELEAQQRRNDGMHGASQAPRWQLRALLEEVSE